MPFVIETAGISISELQSKPRVCEPCESLVEVENVILKKQSVMLVLHLVTSTKESQTGRSFVEHLSLPEPNRESSEALKKRILRFLLALGQITEKDIQSGADLNIEFEKLKGKRAIVQFVSNQNSQIQIPFYGIWHLDDPDCPAVP